jgi:hypothetical protein
MVFTFFTASMKYFITAAYFFFLPKAASAFIKEFPKVASMGSKCRWRIPEGICQKLVNSSGFGNRLI